MNQIFDFGRSPGSLSRILLGRMSKGRKRRGKGVEKERKRRGKEERKKKGRDKRRRERREES